MGAFLAFQGVEDDAQAEAALAPAVRWLQGGVGLPRTGAVGGRAGACKFGRRVAPSSPLVTSPHGWLVAAGTFVHPRVDAVDDAQALLALLEREGPSALEELDGLAAVAWHDARSDDLHVATDPLGRLHCFVAETAEGLWVGTSSIALAAATSAEPDPVGIFEMLAGGVMYADRTPFRAVRRLPGGTRVRCRAGRTRERVRYGDLPDGTDRGGSPEDLARRLLDTFDPLLGKALEGYPDPMPDLTGGLDSRVVVALLARRGLGPSVTVTGDSRDADVRVARKLAKRAGLELIVEPRSVMQRAQGSLDAVRGAARLAECGCEAIEYAGTAAIHLDHARRAAASLNGSGGEVYRNYWWAPPDAHLETSDAIAPSTRRFAVGALEPAILAGDARREIVPHYREVVTQSLAARPEAPFPARMDHVYLDLRMQCWQGGIASATNRIWPNLSPLMWLAPLRVLLAADPALRAGGRLFRALMAEFGPVWARTSLADGFPPLQARPVDWWRFFPGLVQLPVRMAPKIWRRLGLSRAGRPAADPGLRALMAAGAREVLERRTARLAPLLDAARYDAWLEAATRGEASPALVGRLLSCEWALGGAADAAREGGA